MPSNSKSKTLHRATIQCGLLAVPAKVMTLIDNKAGISFVQLHRACGCRVKQPTFCPECDTEIAYAEIVKGYEISKGQYVQFSAEEIKAFGVEGNSVEVVEFVSVQDIDPMYYDKSYVVGPDKGGERAYGLLHTALLQSGRVAVSRYRTRGKEYLAVLRPVEGGFLLHTLFYDAAVREVAAVADAPDCEYTEAELAATQTFIDAYSNDSFDLAAHLDNHTAAVKAQIEAKVSGGDVSAAPAPNAQAAFGAVDLTDMMLSAAKAKDPSAGKSKKSKKPAAKKTSKKASSKKPAAKKSAPKKGSKKASAKKAS
jgi:DNA end-binding protein Ku